MEFMQPNIFTLKDSSTGQHFIDGKNIFRVSHVPYDTQVKKKDLTAMKNDGGHHTGSLNG